MESVPPPRGARVAKKSPECPHCGAQVARDAVECDKCGHRLGDAELDTLLKALRVDRAKVAESPVEKEKGSGALFLCGGCGAFVDASAKKCEKCGTELDFEEEAPAAVASQGTVLCNSCGAILREGLEKCGVCGAPVTPLSASAEGDAASEGPVCETCGAALGEDGVCRICSAIEAVTGSEPAAAKAAAPESPPQAEESAAVASLESLGEAATEPAPEPAERRSRQGRRRKEERAAEPPQILELEAPPPEPASSEAPQEVPVEAEAMPAAPEPGLVVAEPAPEGTAEPTPPRPRTVDPRLLPLAELSVYGSAAGLLVGFLAAQSGLPGREWVLLFLFGVLFGLVVIFLAASWRGLALGGKWTLLALGGAALLWVVPLRWYAGTLFVLELDVTLLAAGTAALLLGTLRVGHRSNVLLPCASGLFLLMVLSLLPIASNGAQAAVTGALWGVGGLLVLAAVAMALQGRLLETRIRSDVETGRARHVRLDPRGSLASYDRAIERSKRSATGMSDAAWTSKGAALLLLGEYDEAIQCLDTAVRLNPGNALAWLNRGNALARKGQLKESLWSFNKVIEIDPRYEVAWNNKGNTLARLGNYAEALKCYERALAIDRDYRGAWVNKGFVLAKLGYYEEAALCADRVLSIARKPAAA